MGSKLYGERMELPDMGPSSAPGIPPPYSIAHSIAPLGFDVRPPASTQAGAPSDGMLLGGSIFAAVLALMVTLAVYTSRPVTVSPKALLASLPPVVAAAPPFVLPVLSPVAVASDSPAASPAASDAPPADTAGASKKTKSAARHIASRKASSSTAAGSNLGASAGDDAFMRAIRASSH
jgi:hypothetical protein